MNSTGYTPRGILLGVYSTDKLEAVRAPICHDCTPVCLVGLPHESLSRAPLLLRSSFSLRTNREQPTQGHWRTPAPHRRPLEALTRPTAPTPPLPLHSSRPSPEPLGPRLGPPLLALGCRRRFGWRRRRAATARTHRRQRGPWPRRWVHPALPFTSRALSTPPDSQAHATFASDNLLGC